MKQAFVSIKISCYIILLSHLSFCTKNLKGYGSLKQYILKLIATVKRGQEYSKNTYSITIKKKNTYWGGERMKVRQLNGNGGLVI